MTAPREDYRIICELIEGQALVLDVGCGDGDLLALLRDEKTVRGRGLDKERASVAACLTKGLSAVQGNADEDLADYPDGAFDYVILSHSIQAMRHPDRVLAEALRIARYVIVTFPNFAHWRIRLDLLLRGRMPVTRTLPVNWYKTPNIHLCTVRDFTDLCSQSGARIVRSFALRAGQQAQEMPPNSHGLANWRAEEALFLLDRPGPLPG